MNRKKIILHSLLTLFLLMLVGSCQEDNVCRKEKRVVCKVSIMVDSLNHKTNKKVVEKLTIKSLSATGIGAPIPLYDKIQVSSFDLLLNQLSDESSFKIIFDNEIDTVTIFHTNNTHYLSLKCGVTTTFNIDSISSTKNFIDSISIKNKTVDIKNVENIQIHHFK